MKIIRSFKFVLNIGFGFWIDRFNGEYNITGHYYVLLLPFMIIRWGQVKKYQELNSEIDKRITNYSLQIIEVDEILFSLDSSEDKDDWEIIETQEHIKSHIEGAVNELWFISKLINKT
jgi:hypothetical protein